jgi:hypothetical protein
MVTRQHWLTHVVSDDQRTTNAIRLARWATLATALVAAAIIALAIASPIAAAGLLGAGALTIRRRRLAP